MFDVAVSGSLGAAKASIALFLCLLLSFMADPLDALDALNEAGPAADPLDPLDALDALNEAGPAAEPLADNENSKDKKTQPQQQQTKRQRG